MNATAFALVGYISWFLVLLLSIALLRASVSIGRGKPVNSFATDGSDVSAFSVRLCRVHANCYESFPFIGGLLLLALATDSTHITDPLALVLLASRLGQSIVHLWSTSSVAVTVRFVFFLAQFVIAAYWAVRFLGKFAV